MHRRPPAYGGLIAAPAQHTSTTTVLHVVPRPNGDWMVYAETGDEALSTHLEATAAVRAAVERAGAADGARVILHDRYGRTHDPRPPGTPRRDAGRFRASRDGR